MSRLAVRMFQDENKLAGLPPGLTQPIQAGISNLDTGENPEVAGVWPWLSAVEASWLEYRNWVEVILDAGMALHKPLPQKAQRVDTLANGFIHDFTFNKLKVDTNLQSLGDYADIIQRMATSDYRFALRGYAVRVGYKIPIPGIKTIAGIPATPAERQEVTGPYLIGNSSGVPVWAARWDLWYYVGEPPQQAQEAPPNLAENIRGNVKLPDTQQIPISQPDQNSVVALPSSGPRGYFIRPKQQ